jgi:hypothetical protein
MPTSCPNTKPTHSKPIVHKQPRPSPSPNSHTDSHLSDLPTSRITIEPIHTEPITHKHLHLETSSYPVTFVPEILNPLLKRKSPPPLHIVDPKKAKTKTPSLNLIHHSYEDLGVDLVSPIIISSPGVVAPISTVSATLVPIQKFPMAEETGLIMPPSVP